jgi:hypothetical protein
MLATEVAIGVHFGRERSRLRRNRIRGVTATRRPRREQLGKAFVRERVFVVDLPPDPASESWLDEIPESRSVRFPGRSQAADGVIGITESVRARRGLALDDRRMIFGEDPQALEGPCWSGGSVIRCLLPTITTFI